MFTDGAKWDQDKLVIVDSDFGVLHTPVTIIHLLPLPADKKEIRHVYECPFYRTAARQGKLDTSGQSNNFIVPIEMPMDKKDKKEKWIKRGVCLLTQLDE